MRTPPLLPAGVVFIAGGCAVGGAVNSLWVTALWGAVMGLDHLCFVIGARSPVVRRSAPHEQDRGFGHFTIGASLSRFLGPIAAGALIGGPYDGGQQRPRPGLRGCGRSGRLHLAVAHRGRCGRQAPYGAR